MIAGELRVPVRRIRRVPNPAGKGRGRRDWPAGGPRRGAEIADVVQSYEWVGRRQGSASGAAWDFGVDETLPKEDCVVVWCWRNDRGNLLRRLDCKHSNCPDLASNASGGRRQTQDQLPRVVDQPSRKIEDLKPQPFWP